MPHLAAPLAARMLSDSVANVSHLASEIVAAMDAVVSGFWSAMHPRMHSAVPLSVLRRCQRAQRALLALALAWFCLPAMAQAPAAATAAPAAPAAPAASAPVAAPPMSIVGEWQGPFNGTKVVKLLDAEDGVACYFYMPVSVPSNTVCSNDACNVHYPSGVGSVSCVKVREGARAPAKAAPKR